MVLLMKIILFVFFCFNSQQVLCLDFKKGCEGLNYKTCLHSQGLYTDDELENMEINQVEVAIHQDKNSQRNFGMPKKILVKIVENSKEIEIKCKN